MGLQYVAEGARRGERSLMLSLDEQVQQILRNAASPDFSYRLKGLKGKRRVCTLKWWRYDSATVESPGGRSGGVGIGAVEYDRWRCLFRQRAAAFVSAARARAKSR
jgi:hypothetical protein